MKTSLRRPFTRAIKAIGCSPYNSIMGMGGRTSVPGIRAFRKSKTPQGTGPLRRFGNEVMFGRSGGLAFKGLLGLGDDGAECGGVGDREIGEDLAIRFDTGGLEAFDEAGVGQSFVACGSADALDPQAAELAFALFAVTVFVGLGLADGVFRVTEELRAETAEALGTQQDALTTGAAGRGVGCTWHGIFWCRTSRWLFLPRPVSLVRCLPLGSRLESRPPEARADA